MRRSSEARGRIRRRARNPRSRYGATAHAIVVRATVAGNESDSRPVNTRRLEILVAWCPVEHAFVPISGRVAPRLLGSGLVTQVVNGVGECDGSGVIIVVAFPAGMSVCMGFRQRTAASR